MKQLFTFVFLAVLALTATAKDYTVNYTITPQGMASERLEGQTISVEKVSDTQYTVTLKNFKWEGIDQDLVLNTVVTEPSQDGTLNIAGSGDFDFQFLPLGKIALTKGVVTDASFYGEFTITIASKKVEIVTDKVFTPVTKEYTTDITITQESGTATTLKDQAINVEQTSETEYTLTMKDFVVKEGTEATDVAIKATKDAEGNITGTGSFTFAGLFPAEVNMTKCVLTDDDIKAEMVITMGNFPEVTVTTGKVFTPVTKEYTEDITFTNKDDVVTQKDKPITIEQTSETDYTITLKDFTYNKLDLSGIQITAKGEKNEDGTVSITGEGTKDGVMGAYTATVTINEGTLSEEHFTADLSIAISDLGMTLEAHIGKTAFTPVTKEYTEDVTVIPENGDAATTTGKTIVLEQTSETEYTLTLKDFKYDILPLGDISIKAEGTPRVEGGVTLEGETTLELMDGKMKVNIVIVTAVADETNLTAELHIQPWMGEYKGTPMKVFIGKVNSIGNTADAQGKKVSKMYTLDGMEVDNMQKGKVYIVRYADGTTKKVAR